MNNLEIIDIGLIRKKLTQLQEQSWVQVFKMYAKNLKETNDYQLLVIDSLPVLNVLAKFENPREDLFHLFEWLRDLGVTTILITEMDAETKKLSGPQRAAILMMSLGDDGASHIMKNLEPKEVQAVGEAMASLESVNRDEVNIVVSDFATTLGTQTSLGSSSEDYLRNVLKKALGEDKAANLIDRILLGRSSRGLEAMKWMEPRAIADFLRQEHPQLVSIVLSYLDPDQAAEVLALMPENTRAGR